MDPDDSADLSAILGLAGAGLGLLVVASLDLTGVAVVLAVVIPSLAAVLFAVVAAAIHWHHTRSRSASRRGGRASCRDNGDQRRRSRA